MSAAAGEPVGRKAYWSPKDKDGGGENGRIKKMGNYKSFHDASK